MTALPHVLHPLRNLSVDKCVLSLLGCLHGWPNAMPLLASIGVVMSTR